MLSFSTRSDLVKVGFDDDGGDLIAEVFYVVARAADGRQWAHDHSFSDLTEKEDREYGKFWARDWTVREKADALAVHIEGAYAVGRRLDPAHWAEIDPAYGSAAYQRLDAQGYFLADERARDRDRGEVVPFDLGLDGGLEAFQPGEIA